MCLAIVKPKGKIVPEEYIREGFNGNPHGAGLAYAEKGRLTISKGYFNVERFIEDYTAVEHLPALIHFRLATHGKMNQENCHPFPMLDATHAVIHNGIINIQSTPELSDTGHFVKLVLEPMVKTVPVGSPALKYLVEQSVGSFNKLAVMNAHGKVTIFNEGSGHWKDGVWYSNTGYLPSMLSNYGSMADYDYDYKPRKYKLTAESIDREWTIKKIMKVEACSRLDAEWMEENGWPWDYEDLRKDEVAAINNHSSER